MGSSPYIVRPIVQYHQSRYSFAPSFDLALLKEAKIDHAPQPLWGEGPITRFWRVH
jgi:hypothetical protein